MAIFLPNTDAIGIHPLAGGDSLKGTLLHVVGSPFTGFGHNIRRNYDCTASQSLESAIQIGTMLTQYVPAPPSSAFSEETTAIGVVDRYALAVEPPRAAARPLIAVSIAMIIYQPLIVKYWFSFRKKSRTVKIGL